MGSKATARQRSKVRKSAIPQSKSIVIDEEKGLIFANEGELFNHFLPQITALEHEYEEFKPENEIPEEKFDEYEELLQMTLDEPDEIWEDAESIHGSRVYTYVAHFANDEESVFYVALCYITDGIPSFVYLHFPSNSIDFVDRYRRGEILFDRAVKEVEKGAIEGDALGEGDELAMGLYKAMLKLRSEKDIEEEKFHSYEELRDQTIDSPDEIWRSNDLSGNVLVTFIKDFSDNNTENVKYVVVTQEDSGSSSHSLLFSFPTNDDNLLERYRHGENLQAEEVVQEASH